MDTAIEVHTPCASFCGPPLLPGRVPLTTDADVPEAFRHDPLIPKGGSASRSPAPSPDPPQHRADTARLQYLAMTGGVWLDSTIIMLQPLEFWLDPSIEASLFAFYSPSPWVMVVLDPVATVPP